MSTAIQSRGPAACLPLLLCLLVVRGIAVPSDSDPVVAALSVAPEDQEPCARDADCDDWCKERHNRSWVSCLCRCPGFVPAAELTCPAANKYCQPAPAPLWGGDFNLSSGRPFRKACKKHPLMLVVFSAVTCQHCIDFEPSYRWGAEALSPLGIPLARVNVDTEKEFANEHGVSTLPHITVFEKCKARGAYRGLHSPAGLLAYGQKLRADAVSVLTTEADVEAFAGAHNVSVLGFISDDSGAEEEEEEFREAAGMFRYTHNVYFALVTAPSLLGTFSKREKWFVKSPSVVVMRNFDQALLLLKIAAIHATAKRVVAMCNSGRAMCSL